MDKTPQNPDAEKAVLSCLMQSPESFLSQDLRPEMFFNEGRKALFSAILTQEMSAQPVNPIAITDLLRTQGQLDLMGPADIAEIFRYVSSAQELGYWVEKLRASLIQRQMLEFSQKARLASQSDKAPLEALRALQSDCMTLGQDDASQSIKSASEGIQEAMAASQASLERGGGIQTGLAALDSLSGGLHPGEMTVIGARPSLGKTALALQILLNVATAGESVLMFSAETQAARIWQRILANKSSVLYGRIRSGELSPTRDMPKYSRAIELMQGRKFWVDDTPAPTIESIVLRATQHSRINPVGVIAIDYLQLIRTAQRMDSRQRVDEVCNGANALAKNLNCSVLLLAQLTRDADEGKPRLKHLKESGGIEQAADNVWLLDGERGDPERSLIMAKQRDGNVGDELALNFNGELMQWRG